ncbi:hypothetical protein [Salinimicrobium sediminilitoris]|uniref:hypothetical protein n=1 Tax=Salinimicrobium sediminilitoris TaxID=2876715 RepID=UPI001E5C360C|nr:hypothetical protein [Salinimicrobium sediminilitoris]MCC8359873.1 hypothetical protein [Salinimicrobium sediminilitoris]
MRISAHFYVIVATLLLVSVAVMVFYNVSYDIVFYTVIAGQAWWLLTVYKVITDNYSTDKTFDDWYEDHPIGKEEI